MRPIPMWSRRAVLRQSLKFSAGLAAASSLPDLLASLPVQTLAYAEANPVPVPGNFTGLGYEMSSIAPLGLLSTTNHRYVNLVKGLGPQGVLRAGGIVANYTRYEPNGTIKADMKDTVITRASLEQLGHFVDTIGWSVIWSVNFAQGTLEEGVTEAEAVASVLGSRLLALELGNEVEHYGNKNQPFRKLPYSYEEYRREYNLWHRAIVEKVPHIPFAAPDTGSNLDWVEEMARDAKGDVQLLTTHYYHGNQRRGSVADLLHTDPHLTEILQRMRLASQQSGIPWRMCESNSFTDGGLPGVSDTMIGALWVLDYMLSLAAGGCSGVNIETGMNQKGYVSCYSPIQDNGEGVNSAGTPYYGMLAFAAAQKDCSEAIAVKLPQPSDNVTAYAMGNGGKARSVTLINRSDNDLRVSATALGLPHHIHAMRMVAPSSTSKTGVTFAGAVVDDSGRWRPQRIEQVDATDIALPRMSAVVLRG